MGILIQDLRFAFRMLRKSPSFTFAAVLTLTLAIGANAVVFGALNALVLRPLNVPHAESLFELGRSNGQNESYPSYVDLRDRNRSFDSLAAAAFDQVGLDTGDGPARSWGYSTSGNYFDVLGVQPYLGRLFHASDEHGPNSAPYIVLSCAYWHTHFHDDRGVVGHVVQLNKHPFTIIGVTPPRFVGILVAFSPDFFVPMVSQEQTDGNSLLNARGNHWIDDVLGHLRPGVTPAQATADLNSIGTYLLRNYPKEETDGSFGIGHPGLGDLFNGAVRAFIAGLMLLAGLILLAACANLGSLFTARAAERSREVALRLALGSSRQRILRGLFTEAIVVSLAGGGLGLWGSAMLLRGLGGWHPFPEFPVNVTVSPDAHVYAIALLLALVSGFLFGAVPVRQVLRTDPYEIVKSGASSTRERRMGARDWLLGVQIAICAVLVTSSLVAVRGLLHSLHVHLGVEPRNAMLVSTDLSTAGYRPSQTPAIEKRILEASATIPGVTAVGLVGDYPPLHMGWSKANIFTEQASDLRPSQAVAEAISYNVSPGYFQAAGTMLLWGRDFNWHDDQNAPRVAIINQVFAHKVFGSPARALGSYFKLPDGARVQVSGIVEDGKYTANLAENPQLAVFLPIPQSPASSTWMVVRSSQDPQQLASAIRGKLRDLDAGLPAFIQTWGSEMNGAMFAPRMATLSLGVLGMLGAMLSITGIFGMAAYSVSKRKRELGIRIALGARHREVLQAALGRAVRLLALGSALGLLLGILASRVLAFVVYEATPRDPLVLAGCVLAMALLGLVATWVPARRALAIDPMVLLREE